MESLGLGTKSTRAEIIAKLYRRKYITGRKKIRPTPLGELVYDLLKEYAPEAITPELTATLESHLTAVEQGKRRRDEVVEETRTALDPLVDRFLSEAQNIRRRVSDGAQA